jgi:hypothetical protein
MSSPNFLPLLILAVILDHISHYGKEVNSMAVDSAQMVLRVLRPHSNRSTFCFVRSTRLSVLYIKSR